MLEVASLERKRENIMGGVTIDYCVKNLEKPKQWE